MKRVVVTGVGPVTSIGVGADAFAEGQRSARNGIRHITLFDASDLTVRIGGEIDVDVSAYIPRKEAKRLDRFGDAQACFLSQSGEFVHQVFAYFSSGNDFDMFAKEHQENANHIMGFCMGASQDAVEAENDRSTL